MQLTERVIVKRFIRSLLLLSLAAGLIGALSSNVFAYTWSTCGGNKLVWNNGWTNMYINTTSFPAGSSWDSRLQNAMWHWNNVKGSRFNFYVGYDTDGTYSHSNGVNEVYLASDISGALAVTYVRSHCNWNWWFQLWDGGLNETDIGFNANNSWSTGTYNYSGGSPFSFEGVALHELGHALGLDHEDRAQTTMNSYYPDGGPLGHWKEWDPLADDRAGVRYLYPDGTTEVDIAASPLKWIGSGSSGWLSSPWSAYRGSIVNIEFTFANQSTTTQYFNIGFYLSTNDYISSYDTLLGWNTGAGGVSGATVTYPRSLAIPTWISPGTYYLGFIVDYDGVLGEANESNNYQEMPHAITIY